MYQPYFWKKFPVSVQWLRPWVLASLALHAVVLSVPLLPSATLPKLEETVNLAPTPLLPPSSAAIAPPTSASATPKAIPVPAQRSTPKPALPAQTPLAVVRPPRIAAPVVSPDPSTPIPAPTPTPVAIASPATVPVESPSPTLSPSPTVLPSPTLSPSPSPVLAIPSPDSPNPYANFPQVEGATAGCGGRENCWQSADTQWRAIAQNLEKSLQDQGYSVSQLDLETDTGIRVYRVSKSDAPDYYLNFISTFQGTVYLISEQPMTAAEIRQEAERKNEG